MPVGLLRLIAYRIEYMSILVTQINDHLDGSGSTRSSRCGLFRPSWNQSNSMNWSKGARGRCVAMIMNR